MELKSKAWVAGVCEGAEMPETNKVLLVVVVVVVKVLCASGGVIPKCRRLTRQVWEGEGRLGHGEPGGCAML